MELERTDVSQEIWRNERSRGRSWRTKLSNEFPPFREHFFVSPTLYRVTFNNVSDTHLSSPLHPYNPALYSPRDQIVGTGAAVKTIDDVGCRVRDGKSAIGAEFSPKVCKRREGEGLRALLILAPDNRFTLHSCLTNFLQVDIFKQSERTQRRKSCRGVAK